MARFSYRCSSLPACRRSIALVSSTLLAVSGKMREFFMRGQAAPVLAEVDAFIAEVQADKNAQETATSTGLRSHFVLARTLHRGSEFIG